MELQERLKQIKKEIEVIDEKIESIELKMQPLKKQLEDNQYLKTNLVFAYNQLTYDIRNMEIQTILDKENVDLYKYILLTDYVGTDEVGYILIKKGVNPEKEYVDEFNTMALENLYSYGYVTESDYYDMANDLKIDIDDEDAIEESELADIEIATYDWRVEKIEDLNELAGININNIERWD